ncbi:hypothetical protein ASC99_33920 [Kitasatospora sp. Root107]|nr:hypothetical protein ASC99_33920 [Kitasatospora sp. Root107]
MVPTSEIQSVSDRSTRSAYGSAGAPPRASSTPWVTSLGSGCAGGLNRPWAWASRTSAASSRVIRVAGSMVSSGAR